MPELASVIAANVRAERGRRSWRQVDLGRQIGWSISQVSALETGGRGIHVEDLPLLCQAFRVPLTQLLAHADAHDLAALQIGQDRCAEPEPERVERNETERSSPQGGGPARAGGRKSRMMDR